MAATELAPEGNILDNIKRLPVNREEFTFSDWTVKYEQSHILHSQCSKKEACTPETEFVNRCLFCQYTSSLLNLPHLPDMVFPNNVLTLKHKSGAQIHFKALDALQRVNNGNVDLQVSSAKVWQEARPNAKLDDKTKKFDWTFTTDYSGTLSDDLKEEETDERIDIEKLKQREKILFFHELSLYEDELHDHGIASLSVKIRVMPSSFFVLLRFFLRVDNVMCRVNDTRIYHEFGTSYLLKEYTSKEATYQELSLPLHVYTDSSQLAQYLPLKKAYYTKIKLPESPATNS